MCRHGSVSSSLTRAGFDLHFPGTDGAEANFRFWGAHREQPALTLTDDLPIHYLELRERCLYRVKLLRDQKSLLHEAREDGLEEGG